jgi:hypothetical protein
MPPDPDQTSERRQAMRFPLREPVEYRLILSKRFSIAGKGETLNVGSGGILFSAQHLLPVGGLVELVMEWPARLEGNPPLQLVAACRVLRSDHRQAAVRLERHQLRDARTQSSA